MPKFHDVWCKVAQTEIKVPSLCQNCGKMAHTDRAVLRLCQNCAVCGKMSHTVLKGIVSRDWGGLQMILLDRLEVFIISATHFYFILLPFLYCKFKNGCLRGASFQHSSSKDQYKSGDSNSLADSQKVMRRMLPRSPRSSPEVPVVDTATGRVELI